ncbi:MAG TPA: GYF domain-containing protein [Tahibacter sp.]|uniref:GYF domain-containing protein n=1 Tax=Tahibacter sp. TaxID=2056211 RepID=UPI002C1D0EA1|nr:GYF domain-containing protein [Tahibacter sp.]HSX61072.1 GYF domain-containing protein [Tahibacter sp.]
MTQWYYADRQRQQQGPVASEELVAAFRRGAVDMTTLVWNEKLPNWIPFAQVAAQLGVAGAPPPVPRAAPARREPPKRSGGKTAAIIIGVLLACLLVFGGIIAAISIPAYNDYTIRAKVAGARNSLLMQRVNVAEFYLTNNRCPSNGDEGFDAPESYADNYVARIDFRSGSDKRCQIVAQVRNINARVDGGELSMQVDEHQNWTERATLPNRYLPQSMRH